MINKETEARLTDNDVRQNLKTIHSIIVQTHLNNRPPNKLLNRPPPEIDKTEETLPHSTRRRLSQLRAYKSPLLMTYLNKINEEDYPSPTCPLCNSNDHDTGHLFNCTEIPTDLTTESLWTDPVGAAALLEVWGERLDWPRAADLISFLERFEEILRVVKIDAPGNKVLLHGDFNINLLSCQSNRMSNEFLSSVLSNNLAVTVIKPTRVGATLTTLIDNIFVDNSVNLKYSGVILSNISDHFSMLNIIEVESDSSEDSVYVEIQKRQMNEHNINCLNESICGYDWKTIKQVTSAEDAYNMFSDKLTDLLNINCPYRKFKMKKLDVNKPYITSDIKTMINPLLPIAYKSARIYKILILKLEGIIKKISYERRDYESVDEKSLS